MCALPPNQRIGDRFLMKIRHRITLQTALFSEGSLVILISLITLLLQLISFATTWSGSKVYLEGVFPFASLLFAIAIQATAYFFSNSLRTGIRPLKAVALCAALCCSTYYSYIGIYNSVNSPAGYLQQSYTCVREELTRIFAQELTKNMTAAEDAINTAAYYITSTTASLNAETQNIAACRTALADIQTSHILDMRAPRLSSYENYEDYSAAYQEYIKGISAGSNTENSAARENILSSYGYVSMEALNLTEQENKAKLESLGTALGVASDTASALTDKISDLTLHLSTAIENTSSGQGLSAQDTARLNRLFQAARLCGYQDAGSSSLQNILNQCAGASSKPLMSDCAALESLLPEGHITAANTMALKSAMDSEILSALLTVNSLLPAENQLALNDPRFGLTDLYLIPIKAFTTSETRVTALFCFLVAALIDVLSLLFAVSLRSKKPLWKRHRLPLVGLEEYAPLIYAALPADMDTAQALAEFIATFRPSPQTEADGYMMSAQLKLLDRYGALTALLCQTNLAKLIPSGFIDNESELLLLRARFVFWANTVVYEERTSHRHAGSEDPLKIAI